jgi:hypothetical protein
VKSAALIFRVEATPCRDQFIVMLFMKYNGFVANEEVVYDVNRL